MWIVALVIKLDINMSKCKDCNGHGFYLGSINNSEREECKRCNGSGIYNYEKVEEIKQMISELSDSERLEIIGLNYCRSCGAKVKHWICGCER